MTNELVLDTRELEAPEPMGLVLKNLVNLNENTYIKMIHRIEPLMLYVHLEENNMYHKTINKENEVSIFIWNDTFNDKSKFEEL